MDPVSSADNCNSPKPWLREYDGDPLGWPEWIGMFLSTVDGSTKSADEKLTHLKRMLTGPARRALVGMGYSGVMFDTAWKILGRKFGRPHLKIGRQFTKIDNHLQLRPYDRASVFFAETV